MYSRITGYYRPVKNWNDGKTQEFQDRKVYDLGHSTLHRAGRAGSQVAITDSQAAVGESGVKGVSSGDLMLFATRTCPNCRQAEEQLQQAGIPWRKVLAEENPDLTTRYGVRQAPTLVADDGTDPIKVVGLGAIRQFIQDSCSAGEG